MDVFQTQTPLRINYTAEDFKDAISNPFYYKLNREVTVPIRHEVYKIFCDIGKQNGVEPEIIMNRCLTSYAKTLQEHDN